MDLDPQIEDTPTKNMDQGQTAPDAMVCYCYKLSASQLRDHYAKLGSLKAVQACTKAGNGCGGCRGILQSMFGEEIDDIYAKALGSPIGTPCVKPGQKIMTSFIIANGDIESRIFSCNAIAPQLGDCDASTSYEYVILDHLSRPIHQQQGSIRTNQTFSFDTRELALPRPFFGMFVMGMGRGNYGASRFNVQWGNAVSVTSTHEISVTGRARVFLPVFVSKKQVQTQNDIFLAINNPRNFAVTFDIVVFNPDNGDRLVWKHTIGAYNSIWINATEELYKGAIAKWPEGRFAIKIDTVEQGHEDAVSVYFFFRNRATNLWSSQHL